MRTLRLPLVAGLLVIATVMALLWYGREPAPVAEFPPTVPTLDIPADAKPAPAPPSAEKSSEYTIPKTIRYRFIATNRTGEKLENVKLSMFSPMQLTSTQKLVKLESNIAFDVRQDGLGNRIMDISIDSIPPYAARVIDVESQLMMAAMPQPAAIESADFYLQDAALFDLDDEAIQTTAASLRQADAHATARATYDWVKNYLNYSGYIASDRGAAYAMRTAKGDCTEYAYLLAALARLNGIPARIMAGFVYDNNAILRPYDYHNWVELYVDGRWQIADPLNNAFFSQRASHVALRVIGGDGYLNHLGSQKGIQSDPRLKVVMQ